MNYCKDKAKELSKKVISLIQNKKDILEVIESYNDLRNFLFKMIQKKSYINTRDQLYFIQGLRYPIVDDLVSPIVDEITKVNSSIHSYIDTLSKTQKMNSEQVKVSKAIINFYRDEATKIKTLAEELFKTPIDNRIIHKSEKLSAALRKKLDKIRKIDIFKKDSCSYLLQKVKFATDSWDYSFNGFLKGQQKSINRFYRLVFDQKDAQYLLKNDDVFKSLKKLNLLDKDTAAYFHITLKTPKTSPVKQMNKTDNITIEKNKLIDKSEKIIHTKLDTVKNEKSMKKFGMTVKKQSKKIGSFIAKKGGYALGITAPVFAAYDIYSWTTYFGQQFDLIPNKYLTKAGLKKRIEIYQDNVDSWKKTVQANQQRLETYISNTKKHYTQSYGEFGIEYLDFDKAYKQSVKDQKAFLNYAKMKLATYEYGLKEKKKALSQRISLEEKQQKASIEAKPYHFTSQLTDKEQRHLSNGRLIAK